MNELSQEEQKLLEQVERNLNLLKGDLEETESSIAAATRKKEQTESRIADLESIKAKLNKAFGVSALPGTQPEN